ncbi:sulfatase [Ruficoccus amylovorans]|uniref:Sulfatase n=1 Tax=Ruficoccus amylovorans TaxID=1804625 RepID=A0A842HJ55_9BACT|nr:sulfatase [Ruficoccus amylovorans]MBC2596008.1 sulfatase [Ruficoccus amylovorans]
MSNNRFLGIIPSVATILCAAPIALLQAQGNEQTAPNVLFIAIDDLRPELGAYGNKEIQSPNIDRLAADATLFNQAYSQVPVCGASRSSMLSGMLPTAKRFTAFDSRADEDAPGMPTLPAWFKEHGYTTYSNGKIFHNRNDSTDGWSRPAWMPSISHGAMLNPESKKHLGGVRNRGPFYERAEVEDSAYFDGQVLDKSLADLKELSAAGKPFFLAVGFIRPHLPFYAPAQDWDAFDEGSISLAVNRELPAGSPESLTPSNEIQFYGDHGIPYNSELWHQTAKHGYYACVRYVDRLVGKLLDALEATGQADNTIIVLWGDHGWLLGEHNVWGKLILLPEALRVPLLIRAPGRAPAQSDEVVEAVDIYPTLCGLAGLPVPQHLQGQDLFGPSANTGRQDSGYAYSRMFNGDAVSTERYVYARYNKAGKVEELLLDREQDPLGRKNLTTDSAYAAELNTLRQALDDQMQRAK